MDAPGTPTDEAELHRLGRLLADVRRDDERDEGPAGGPGPSPLRVPGYQILDPLGEGGMGTVWRARQLATRREVALKLMNAAGLGSAKARACFEREVELTARLAHPHIAGVYDSGVRDGVYFYAMELVRGLPLDRYVCENGLPRRQVLQLVRLVCVAVQHAHQKGILHRDLKPSNILVDADGQPHVLDFGLAKAMAGGQTGLTLSLDGDLAGTVGYMSPEQAAGRGDELDTRSDVYSLGVILYRLLTGRSPLDTTGSPLEAMRRVAEREVNGPRRADPTLDAELEAVLLKALARDPAGRYPSAAELAEDLGRYLRGDPLSARPPTLAYFAARRLCRHRLPVAAAAGVALALLVLAGYSYVRIGRARAAAERAGLLAEQRREEAVAQRDLATLSLADAMTSQAAALAQSSRWAEAASTCERARQVCAGLGRPAPAAELGLVQALRFAPPPLNVLTGHRGRVNAVDFSADGQSAVSGGADGTVRVWDVVTGRQVRLLAGHQGVVTCVAFAPDGRTVLSGAKDHTARLWDAATGREVRQFPLAGEVWAVAYSPDSRFVGIVSSDKTARVYDLADGAERSVFGGDGSNVTAVAFAPDGRTCVAGTSSGVAYVWDAATGRIRSAIVARHEGNVVSAVFSPDGRQCLSGSAAVGHNHGGAFWLWDAARGEAPGAAGAADPPFDDVGCGVARAVFSPDGTRVLAAGTDGVVRVFETNSRHVMHSLYTSGAAAAGFGFCPRTNQVLVGGDDGAIRLWSLAAPDSPPVYWQPAGINPAAFSSDGRLVLETRGGTLRICDVATGKCLLRQETGWETTQAAALSAPPAGGMLVLVGSADGSVALWDGEAPAGPDGFAILGRHEADVRAITLSPDGRFGLSVNGNDARLWDPRSRRLVRSMRGDATLAPAAVFSPDGRRATSVTVHGHVVTWDLGSGAVEGITALEVPGDLHSNLAFSPDASVVLGASGSDVFLWDVRTGRRFRTFAGHTGRVLAVALSADGSLAASGGADKTVRLWDPATGRELQSLGGFLDTVRFLAFSPSGRTLLAGDENRSLWFWELDRPAAYRRFDPGLGAARRALQQRPDDPAALATLGEWYALRRQNAWAVLMFSKAEAAGARVSSLALARCCWMSGQLTAAAAEYHLAAERNEAPEPYLRLCLAAVEREIEEASTRPTGAPSPSTTATP